jgi:hypothetical protein
MPGLPSRFCVSTNPAEGKLVAFGSSYHQNLQLLGLLKLQVGVSAAGALLPEYHQIGISSPAVLAARNSARARNENS